MIRYRNPPRPPAPTTPPTTGVVRPRTEDIQYMRLRPYCGDYGDGSSFLDAPIPLVVDIIEEELHRRTAALDERIGRT